MTLTKYLYAFLLIGTIVGCAKEEEEPEVKEPTFFLSDVSGVTTSSAYLSAIVSGEDVAEAGFVTGSSANLGESSYKISLASTAGTITTTFSGLSPETAYYFAAYAKNTEGDFFKSEVKSFVTPKEQTSLSLGDTYEGGIIYYLDGTGEHGLLASPSDITSGTNWQTAFDACYAYELQGNGNWRMPDLDELKFLYERKDYVGGFAQIAYWSRSVEGSNPTLAYGVFFGGGTNAGKSFVYEKTGTYQHSRAIRDF